MPLSFCSNVLYKQALLTSSDITVSFLIQDPEYNDIFLGALLLETGNKLLLQNENFINLEYPRVYDGFGMFLLDSRLSTLTGGGSGKGIGIITDANKTSLSAVSGFFMGVMYDVDGTFALSGGLPQFTTGTVTREPNSLVVRKLSTFEYVGSTQDFNLTKPFNDEWNVFRVQFKNNMQNVVIFKYEDDKYKSVVSYKTNIPLSAVPQSVKIGITWSGQLPIKVKNIAINGTIV